MSNTGTTAYPATLDDYTNVGTATLENSVGYSHRSLHNQVHEAIEAIEATLGTTAGTSVIAGWSAGAVAAKKNNDTLGTPTLNAATLSGVGTVSGTVVGGAFTNPATTGGTITTAVLNAPTMTGLGTITGTINSDFTVADAQDIKYVSGAKIERSDGNLVLTPESGKAVQPVTYYRAKAYRVTSDQTLSTATATTIQLNGEHWDTNNNFDNVTNFRYTVPATGIYHVAAQVMYGGNATGIRMGIVRVNGSDTLMQTTSASGATLVAVCNCAGDMVLTANDLITLAGYQNSGGDLGVTAGIDATWLTIRYICPS